MKKTALLAVALATCLGYVPAQAAEVVSSNIVGYQKVAVPAGMTIIGQQFGAVGGGTNDIQNIKADGLSDGGMDALLVWNGTSYDEYLFYSATDNIKGDGTAAWGNLDWEPIEEDVPIGTGMWANTQGAATITFSGEVGSLTTVHFTAGMNLITQTFPVDVSIQDISAEGLSDGGMDAILVWNGTSYDEYLYYSATDNINGDGKAAWGNLDWESVDATLPAGHGFWLNAQGAGTLTFPAVVNQ